MAAALLVADPVPAQSSSGSSAASDAGAQSDEIRALERQVESILAEARRQQAQLNTQRQRLASAESANAWLPLLFMAVAALGLLCGALALRAWRLQRQLARAQTVVRAPAAPAVPAALAVPTAPAGNAVEAPKPRAADRPLLRGAGPAAARMPPDRPLATPRLVAELGDLVAARRDFGAFGTGVPPRPVSVEELLDLDQQVEFFLALGQAQSAIDLLLGHVRSTGGTNAQPYFKLLEIYRDQGDEEAYERTRERFNQRFNAHAPDWTGDLAGGRPLEDYPEVLQRLQRAWPQPMRAVAELESLLLRRADLEPFDLPAYRDVLMLHALVRDLPAAGLAAAEVAAPPPIGQATTPAVLAREAPLSPGFAKVDLPLADLGLAAPAHPPAVPPPPAIVDLLLPLGEPAHDITLPQPHRAEQPMAQAMLADWVFSRTARTDGATDGTVADRTGAPMRLDLDLSEHAPAPREFTRPAAFTDIDMRRDRRLSDLGGLDDAEPLPSRR
jgi:pilus assembly protein FimV